MGLKYHWKRARKSWDFSLKGRRVAFGFWMSVVIDEASEQSSSNTSAESKREYQYRPLENPKDIRLLELAPGEPKDPLQGRIIHSLSSLTTKSIDHSDTLESSVKYEALSYVWGTFPSWSRMPRLIVDGAYHLPILPSLDAALRHLRFSDAPRTLWIDAICINQKDDQEKNIQVPLMLEIYAGAEIVNIWLGAAQRATPAGMEVLRYLAESTLDNPAPWTRTPEVDFLAGLRDVLQRDWFSRIWVVQEAAVSQKAIMMCGNDSFQWTNDPIQLRTFIRKIKYAAISPQWEQACLSDVNMGMFLQVLNSQMQHIERQQYQTFTLPPDILDIAFEMRHRHASDPRDKLFAIMGLVNQRNGETSFQPDYSVNVEMVFQRLLDSIEI